MWKSDRENRRERERERRDFKGGKVGGLMAVEEKCRRRKKGEEKKGKSKIKIIFCYYNIGLIFNELRMVPKNYRK